MLDQRFRTIFKKLEELGELSFQNTTVDWHSRLILVFNECVQLLRIFLPEDEP
jgi:hypothetical protein